MDIIKEADFRKQLKTSPAGAYLLFGEEDYLKSFALKTAKEILSPDEAFSAFNEMKLDALSYSADALIDAIMPMPMMADVKLITITGLDLNGMRAAEADALCAALSLLDEYNYNTVIISVASDRFDYGILGKKPAKLLTKLSEVLTPVYFEKVSPARLASWVGKHYAHNGVNASVEVCAKTVERCGRDMFNLASETDKISFFVLSQGRDTVTLNDVVSVSVSADEFDSFALTNAITAGKRDEALSVLSDMRFRRIDPVIVMGEIVGNICDAITVELLATDGMTAAEISKISGIHEYKVSLFLRSRRGVDRLKAILEKCREVDAEIKTKYNDYSAIEKLICII